MKRLFIFTITALMLLSSSSSAEEPLEKLDFSVQQWHKKGSFDYYLHYDTSSQLLSKVSAPQNQNMTILKVQYKPTARQFVRIEYGATTSGNNGRGDDSDWTVEGSPDYLTDYGTMDFYGKEKMYSIDIGQEIGKGRKQSTQLFIGWGSNKTYNEIRNVVYHLSDEVPVGNVGQNDLGSTLNGHFYGVHLGIENNYQFDKKLYMDSSLVFRRLTAKAYGHWANHDPSWNWVDRGKTWGYEVKTGMNYAFNKETSTSVGYYYSYAKVNRANELLDTGADMLYFPGQIDLRYVQRGYYFSVNHRF